MAIRPPMDDVAAALAAHDRSTALHTRSATASRADAGAFAGHTLWGTSEARLQLTPVPWHREQRPLPVTAP